MRKKVLPLRSKTTYRSNKSAIYMNKIIGFDDITGGAIKLTRTMQEREHTLMELLKQEQVRQFLLQNHIIDTDSFVDYLAEIY
ncbi:MAG: hypothetical protein MJY59_04550 [Bacteroidaceae bacterium]|nr:hypothetical protein [Bacteroidaceae bacterium]